LYLLSGACRHKPKNPYLILLRESQSQIIAMPTAKKFRTQTISISAFIDYQFNLVKSPEVWICKLENY
jgi:hypothetical protein